MAKKKKKWKLGEQRVPIDVVEPNDWNMNRMDPQMYEKTKLVISETLDEAGRIPPIVVRPHPRNPKKLQIVDGEHRWRIVQDLDYAEIDVVVMKLSDKRAMSMTSELNYNRGTPDPEKYPQYLERMIKEFKDVTPEWIAERHAESVSEIHSLLATANISIEQVVVPDDEAQVSTKDASETDMLVEVKFQLRQGAAEVVERELARIGTKLSGKNNRGRALEYMATLSSQTPIDDIEDAEADDKPKRTSHKPMKARKKRRREEE